MRTENFEITSDENNGLCRIENFALGDELWLDGEDQLQELHKLLGRYLGNLQYKGRLDLDLREDKK